MGSSEDPNNLFLDDSSMDDLDESIFGDLFNEASPCEFLHTGNKRIANWSMILFNHSLTEFCHLKLLKKKKIRPSTNCNVSQ